MKQIERRGQSRIRARAHRLPRKRQRCPCWGYSCVTSDTGRRRYRRPVTRSEKIHGRCLRHDSSAHAPGLRVYHCYVLPESRPRGVRRGIAIHCGGESATHRGGSVTERPFDSPHLRQQVGGVGDAVKPYLSRRDVHCRHCNYVLAERGEVCQQLRVGRTLTIPICNRTPATIIVEDRAPATFECIPPGLCEYVTARPSGSVSNPTPCSRHGWSAFALNGAERTNQARGAPTFPRQRG